MANDVNINEKDLDLVDGYLMVINVNLNNLSSSISSIDLSGLELSYDLSGIVNSIHNAIDGAYNGNGLSQLQENIKTTRAMLENMDSNNAFSLLFEIIDNSDEKFNEIDSFNFKYFFEDPNSPEYKEYLDTIMRYSEILNSGTLDGADLYKLNDTIDADIEAIRNGYLPREASVRLALYYLNMAVNRPNGVATVKYANESQLYSGGLRQPVPNQLIFGSNGYGADCNGVLSWCYFKDGWLEAREYYDNIDLIGEQISFYDAKPGDYFVTDEYSNTHQPHVGLILYNDPVNRKVYTFEASSANNHRGVSLYVHDYKEDGTMVNEYNVGLLCVDPKKLYTEGNMSHFKFTNKYGGNNN